jgi:hypothetical protein
VPGLLAAGGPGALWLAGEGDAGGLVRETFQGPGATGQLDVFTGKPEEAQANAVRWLLRPL